MRGLQLTIIPAAFLACSPVSGQSNPRRHAKPAEPIAVLRRDEANSRDWTLHVEVRLHATQLRGDPSGVLPPSPMFALNNIEFLFPILDSSAMHEVYPSRMTSVFQVDTRPVDKSPDILHGYQSLSSIGIWKAEKVLDDYLVFIMEVPMTCWETRIDESAARRRDWPGAAWSAEMALCLEPQLFVEAGDPAVHDLVRQWTRGDPRARKPYDLAKWLAARVIEHMRITDPPTASQARGVALGQTTAVFVEGFVVHGAAATARAKQGSVFDMACLLTAVYRAAGLPARLVIGYDVKPSEERSGLLLRSWVEFFLPRNPPPASSPDSRAAVTSRDGEWIPVDITRQWEFSSRAPRQELRWEYFGHNEEFDFVVPIAFHWLPPEDCTNTGPPGFWGWRPSPSNQAGDSEIKVWAYETPRKGGVDPRPKKK